MSVDQLIENYYKKYYSFYVFTYTRRCGNEFDAEDIVQEGFTRALTYKHTYNPSKSFNNWISTIVYNCFKDWRHQNRYQGMTIPYNEEDADPVHGTPKRKDLIHFIQQMSANESTHNQEIIHLVYCCDYNHNEVSKFLGVSPESVRAVSFRFRKKVQEYVKEAKIV